MKVYTMTPEARNELTDHVADYLRARYNSDELAKHAADVMELLIAGFAETRWHDPDELTEGRPAKSSQ